MLFDTHAHYDDPRYDGDRDELLASMPENGVGLIVNAGSGIDESRIGLDLSEKYSFLYAAAGVHPHSAAEITNETLDELRRLLSRPKCVALGEIGLDYHYDLSPRDIQKARFRDQMEIAREFRKPVIIHEREAFADVIAFLQEYPDITGVIHCFSGDETGAKAVLDMGYMVSFTGVVTFKKNKSLAVAASIPIDRLMIETDAPYLAPAPHRGERNDSRYVKQVCETIAAARGIPPEDLEEATYANGVRFFQID